MRILIDVHHPAHVHVFAPVRELLLARGHEVDVVARDKDLTIPLLEEFGIPFTPLSVERGRAALPFEMSLRFARLLAKCLRERPDVCLGIAGLTITHVGAALGIPTLVLTDTESARLSLRLHLPFATAILTPRCWEGADYGERHLRYTGFHELFYLHPGRFRPDPEVLRSAGVDASRPFSVARFISWGAVHDAGVGRLSRQDRGRLVEELAREGPVYVSAEDGQVDPPGIPIPVPRSKVHHLLARARLFLGESPTMASEAAVLGVPAVYFDPIGRGYTREEERRYGLVWNTPPEIAYVRAALAKARAVAPAELRARRARLVRECCDPAPLVADLAERLPQGLSVAREAARLSSPSGGGNIEA